MRVKTGLAALLISGLVSGLGATVAWADACSDRDQAGGTILGAITGGVLGGKAANGKGGGNALLDGLAGNAIGRDMDCEDRPYAARTYNQSFHGPVGRRYSWDRRPNRGYVVTRREYRRHGQLCRDFTQVVYRSGRQFDREGSACLRRDGEWEFI